MMGERAPAAAAWTSAEVGCVPWRGVFVVCSPRERSAPAAGWSCCARINPAVAVVLRTLREVPAIAEAIGCIFFFFFFLPLLSFFPSVVLRRLCGK